MDSDDEEVLAALLEEEVEADVQKEEHLMVLAALAGMLVNGRHYNKGYYLADGIYPRWSTFVKTISNDVPGGKKSHFDKVQEACRKDVEQAFGVLQSRFAVVRPTLAHAHNQLLVHGMPAGAQIPSQNFALSLSSSSSNPPPQQRRHLAGATGPYGPFTGYAAVLGRSRFLGPAQKLLEEICDVGGPPRQLEPRRPRFFFAAGDVGHEMDSSDRAAAEGVTVSGAEQQWRKTRLISLMEEVCKRYRQYYQQLQAVISSFETVAGLSNAAPFASIALRTMSKHFKYLKSTIQSQLRNTSKVAAGKDSLGKEDMANFGLMGGGAALMRGSNANAFSQPHNIWRPQRGLPERAVSNWFINARVRLWKPMVEEIHNLEMRQGHKSSAADKNQLGAQQQTQQHSPDSSGRPSDPSNSQQGQSSSMSQGRGAHHHNASRHIQSELSPMTHDMAGQVSFAYNGGGMAAHHHGSMALSRPQHVEGGAGSSGGVSLTLGLHQNNRAYIAEPLPAALPLNLAHRFGLEDVSDAYAMAASFGGQDRHFTKEMGGHLLHDFVG
ncbi:BEL1-like homeodomain protein 9 [Triticum urartu]|uniref:BEL1-like homeodomain protein 9 n=1 Tax=Triticum urartu TaxID=4572 RepID=M7Z3V9_TRIUA|nr:BEL1-like homeodomain protein 9 [Triticum urartu]